MVGIFFNYVLTDPVICHVYNLIGNEMLDLDKLTESFKLDYKFEYFNKNLLIDDETTAKLKQL